MHKITQIQVQSFSSCSDQLSERGINVISATLTMTWLLVPDGLVWVFLKLLGHTQQALEFSQNGMKNKTPPVSRISVEETSCSGERSEEKDQTGWSWQKGYSNSDNHSLQWWWVEKLLRMNYTLNLEVDGLQQQTTCGVPLLSARGQWTQAPKTRKGEDWKHVAWSNASGFLLRQRMVGPE